MKKALFILFVMMFAVGIAAAQQLTGDILGPHNVNGHGCASCHAPHTGAKGNGGSNAASGEDYLWGRDFVAATYTLNGGTETLTVSNAGAFAQDDTSFHTAACLSCHDGSVAIQGMTGTTAEVISGGFHVTTYLNDGSESLKNDHPVNVIYDPTSSRNWPGTVDANGVITWTATTASNAFQANYGRPWRLYSSTTGRDGVGSYIECSSCHNPHAVNWAKSTFAGVKNAVKPTNFFIRGWYNTDNPNSNSGQQFCRSCHYSKSNEYVNQFNIPTT